MKVVTFGEIMLRLAPDGYLRFNQVDHFQATYGGGEANVAVSLANYGIDAEYVTKLYAICQVCGAPATRTQRIIDGKPAKYTDPVVLVGAKEQYEARCRHCHVVIGKPEYVKR